MAVKFILGRSGTGKTSYCVKSIVEALLNDTDDRQLLFLVPEQATFQIERTILSDYKIKGYSCLNVLSFNRLEYLLMGRKTAHPAISRVGRQMIIQRLLSYNKDKLKIFGKTNLTCGFGQQMSDAISEFCRYGKTADDIEEFAKKLSEDTSGSITALKFSDIAVIMRQYHNFIENKFIDPDIQLNSLCKVIGQSHLLKGARLWVDGFAGFTGAEYQVLAEMLRVCSETEIALCLDPEKLNAHQINSEFEPTETTYANLREIINKSKLKISEPALLGKTLRFENNSALRHLEKYFFDISPPKENSCGRIRIISASSQRSEVEFTAKEISRLIRENGYRYRDIAVIATSPEIYEPYIRGYFSDKAIPYFIDKRQPLDEHIAVKFLRSALAVVTNGFKNADIFSYLKSGMTPIDGCQIDLIENYCTAFGVRPDDWINKQNWRFAGQQDDEFDEMQINQTYIQIIEPLLKMRDAFGCSENQWQPISSEDFTKAVFDFIFDLKIYEQLTQWVQNALANNQFIEADKHRQFCERFADVFDELTEAFSGQRLTCKQWAEIICAGFSQTTFALIPPSLDQVLVGSIERSRHPDLKAVFLIGCTQKDFPAPVGYNGLLTETDRSKAKSNKFELGPGLRDNLTQREYLAYIAFTRPAEFLYISYPLLESKNNSESLSQFVIRLKSMFQDIGVETISTEKQLEQLETKSELTEFLCTQLGKEPDNHAIAMHRQLIELLEEMSSDSDLSGLAHQVKWAINYDNRAVLDSQLMRQLFTGQIESSATKIETFAACPYQYFARYSLELQERKEFKLRPLDKGLFYHKVLDEIMKELHRRKTDIAELSEDELNEMFKEQITQLLKNDNFVNNFSEHSKHNQHIINTACNNLQECFLAISKLVKAGVFRPKQSEQYFDDYQINLPNGKTAVLHGKIDRIDTANIDGRELAVVFDYKLSPRTYSWSQFYHGLDMQLVIYMLALKAAKNRNHIEPIGAFYIPIEIGTAKRKNEFGYKAKGIFNGEFYEYIDKNLENGRSIFYNFQLSKEDKQYGNYSRSGALKKDDFEKVLSFAKIKIAELIKSIIEGKIEVSPYRLNNKVPCGYCKYKSVCRFDWQINDYRPLAGLSKAMALEKI